MFKVVLILVSVYMLVDMIILVVIFLILSRYGVLVILFEGILMIFMLKWLVSSFRLFRLKGVDMNLILMVLVCVINILCVFFDSLSLRSILICDFWGLVDWD